MAQRHSYEFPTVQYVKRLRMSIDFTEHPEAAAGPSPLPPGFYWIPWHPCLTDVHGRVKYLSFRHELDAVVFPTFTRFDGCLNLMRTIASHPGFVSRGTWLIGCRKGLTDRSEPANLQSGSSDTPGGVSYNAVSCPPASHSISPAPHGLTSDAVSDGVATERELGYWPILRRPEEENLEFCATIQGLRTAPETCAIQNVAVRPEFRRKGLGRALLMKALAGFKDAGAHRVTLEATAQNRPAVRLYETVGFQVYQTVYKEAYLSR